MLIHIIFIALAGYVEVSYGKLLGVLTFNMWVPRRSSRTVTCDLKSSYWKHHLVCPNSIVSVTLRNEARITKEHPVLVENCSFHIGAASEKDTFYGHFRLLFLPIVIPIFGLDLFGLLKEEMQPRILRSSPDFHFRR